MGRPKGRISDTPKVRGNSPPKKRAKKRVETEVECLKSGITYKVRSGFEGKVGGVLNDMGYRFNYESVELPFSFPVPNTYCGECGSWSCYRDRIYTPDYVINEGTETEYYFEVKGKLTPAERAKFKAIRVEYPDADIRFIFMRDNWITKKHISRYSDWAKKAGYSYAIGAELPGRLGED